MARIMAKLLKLYLSALPMLFVVYVVYDIIFTHNYWANVEVSPPVRNVIVDNASPAVGNVIVDNASPAVRNITVDYANGFPDQMNPGLAAYISKQWIIPPSTQPLKLDEPTVTDFSQVGQSAFVDKLLAQRVGGFYVECGAANGEKLSNTLFFERERNWTGLLIEANPKMFNNTRGKQRHAYLINACLSTSTSTGRMPFYMRDVLGGLNNTKGEATLVQCFPFYPVLLATGNTRVDYLSLDVEGSELDILHTIPFHDVFIDVIGAEYAVYGETGDVTVQRLHRLREFFKGLGMYREVGIVPWGTHFNVDKEEYKGLDVFFKHV